MNGGSPITGSNTETAETRIYITDDAEVRGWIEKFGCSREDLVYAVHKIGTSAEKVEAYLKRR